MSSDKDLNLSENGPKSHTTSDIFRDTSSLPKRIVSQKFFDYGCMLLAEVIGTATLMFLGCMGCVGLNGIPPEMLVPLNFGFTVMLIIQLFGHVSYAILNPAVVIAAVVNELITIKMGILYIISEIVGAILGFGLLKMLTPNKFLTPNEPSDPGLCMTLPHSDLSVGQAFFIEFFLTCALISVICGAWDPRNQKNSDSTPIRIGLTVAALSIAGGPYTGASMNPVRSLAPALWNWDWRNHWIYWVAPLIAALMSSIFYKMIFWRKESNNDDDETSVSQKIING